LGQLQQEPPDQEAWGRFVQRYGARIYGWCRQWDLQPADAEDVTQTVLARLVVRLRTFAYDPARSFRAWLKTLTHHAWHDFLQSRRGPDVARGDSAARGALETAEAGADLVRRLEEAFDLELLEAAMARVQRRVAPHTWAAFRLTALEGLSGAAAAAQLGIKVAAVFAARKNVQHMLREEVARLEGPGPP
jgi:RNA polymerase sigma-70 factor (ECF subfamily)